VTRNRRQPAFTPSAAVLIALVALLAACSSPSGATSSWSFGPSLEPAASGSAAPSASAAASASPSPAASASPSAIASAAASASPGGAATKLTIGTKTDEELEFDPDSVEVPTGAKVSVTFENRATVPHNLTFKEPINVATSPVVEPGGSETIEFTAPAPGDYVFACTIHPGMEGKLTVEPAG
jgi:plastocyanin